ERNGQLLQPHANSELRAGDVLFVDLFAPEPDIKKLRKQYSLDVLPITGSYFTDRSQDIGMAEVIVPAQSKLVGKTVVETKIRDRFRVTVIGLKRGKGEIQGTLQDEQLKVGDTLLVVGS